jgi:negative regulator of sigma E activity
VDHAGTVIQELSFANIALPDTIADERLKPSFDASKFHWMHRDVPAFTAGLKKSFAPRPELLPAGFRVRLFSSPPEEREAQRTGQVRTRFIVSDGIDWVSVFVKPVEQGAAPKNPRPAAEAKGAARAAPDAKDNRSGVAPVRADGVVVMGTSATYVARMGDSMIIVVGDVPPTTVKLIAEAVRSD